MSRILDAFFDPTGTRYGVPTWPWWMAPPHLLTRLRWGPSRVGEWLWKADGTGLNGWQGV
ncbi:hypothetical protein [Sphaerisporangium aureirubrum]|uniref:Uncharacterized protein n=1 Tax=Sphaerisporangium aureirubrum TaxID=1544736 RepID=A0ABW1NFD0_9ACTN